MSQVAVAHILARFLTFQNFRFKFRRSTCNTKERDFCHNELTDVYSDSVLCPINYLSPLGNLQRKVSPAHTVTVI